MSSLHHCRDSIALQHGTQPSLWAVCLPSCFGVHLLKQQPMDPQEAVISNASGMTLAFLGTGHNQAMHHRAHPSVALVRAKDVLMFDVGEHGSTQQL